MLSPCRVSLICDAPTAACAAADDGDATPGICNADVNDPCCERLVLAPLFVPDPPGTLNEKMRRFCCC